MKVRVDVNLKDGVLDPQGKAVAHALQNLGFSGVQDVRVGKTIELDLGDTDATQAQSQAKAMAEQLLANQVIENYRINLL
jgi:phosphoribosylformylglycinamidine synthase subunit PurS